MKLLSQSLFVLIALSFLHGCDQSKVSEKKPSTTTISYPKDIAMQFSQAAPALVGEALYNSDKAPNSQLYDLPTKVVDGVWSAIGATSPGTYANAGHNNNLSFVITSGGVLVVNAGANYLLAKALHDEIKKLTDQPVKYVVLENGQGHAMLGTGYWQEQGAIVIAHEDAAHEISENSFAILAAMKRRQKEQAKGTVV